MFNPSPAYKVYERTMILSGNGWPQYSADPVGNTTLHWESGHRWITFGDVGYTKEGRFHRIINILREVFPSFSMESQVVWENKTFGCPIIRGSAKLDLSNNSVEVSTGGSHDGELSFEDGEGAILNLESGHAVYGYLSETDSNLLGDYMLKNYRRWLNGANFHRIQPSELVLVTGMYMTGNWEAATFQSSPTSRSAKCSVYRHNPESLAIDWSNWVGDNHGYNSGHTHQNPAFQFPSPTPSRAVETFALLNNPDEAEMSMDGDDDANSTLVLSDDGESIPDNRYQSLPPIRLSFGRCCRTCARPPMNQCIFLRGWHIKEVKEFPRKRLCLSPLGVSKTLGLKEPSRAKSILELLMHSSQPNIFPSPFGNSGSSDAVSENIDNFAGTVLEEWEPVADGESEEPSLDIYDVVAMFLASEQYLRLGKEPEVIMVHDSDVIRFLEICSEELGSDTRRPEGSYHIHDTGIMEPDPTGEYDSDSTFSSRSPTSFLSPTDEEDILDTSPRSLHQPPSSETGESLSHTAVCRETISSTNYPYPFTRLAERNHRNHRERTLDEAVDSMSLDDSKRNIGSEPPIAGSTNQSEKNDDQEWILIGEEEEENGPRRRFEEEEQMKLKEEGRLRLQRGKDEKIAAFEPFALATTMQLSCPGEVTYVEHMQSPKLDLNQGAEQGKFASDRDFLSKFTAMGKEKPKNLTLTDIIGVPGVGASGRQNRVESHLVPYQTGVMDCPVMDLGGPFNQNSSGTSQIVGSVGAVLFPGGNSGITTMGSREGVSKLTSQPSSLGSHRHRDSRRGHRRTYVAQSQNSMSIDGHAQPPWESDRCSSFPCEYSWRILLDRYNICVLSDDINGPLEIFDAIRDWFNLPGTERQFHLWRSEETELLLSIIEHIITAIELKEQESRASTDQHTLCLSWMREIIRKTGILPRSLILKDVKLTEKDPVACGSFADVYRGTFEKCPVAIKVIRATITNATTLQNNISRELAIWQSLKHPNIVPFLGITQDSFTPLAGLVSPWMTNGSILQYLEDNPQVNREALLIDSAKGLSYLHGQTPTLVHGDVKATNILVDDVGNARLSDFGFISIVETECFQTTSKMSGGGSLRWMAPELIAPSQEETRNHTSDIYAFAMTVFEIFTGVPPFSEVFKNDAQLRHAIVQGSRPDRPNNKLLVSPLSDKLWEVVQRCWATDPKTRPSADKLLLDLQALETIKDEEPEDITETLRIMQALTDELEIHLPRLSGSTCSSGSGSSLTSSRSEADVRQLIVQAREIIRRINLSTKPSSNASTAGILDLIEKDESSSSIRRHSKVRIWNVK